MSALATLITILLAGFCVGLSLMLAFAVWDLRRIRRKEEERREMQHLLGAKQWWGQGPDGPRGQV